MYMYVHCISVHAYKLRKLAKIRNRYAQVPHLTKDTTWENEKKKQLKITNESQEVSPFPAGDHEAEMNRRKTYVHILNKTIEGHKNSFDYITFEKIISKQIIFVSDRTTNMQISKMQNKIYGPLVMIRYHTKCTNPFYPKFTSKTFSVYILAATLTWSLLMF